MIQHLSMPPELERRGVTNLVTAEQLLAVTARRADDPSGRLHWHEMAFLLADAWARRSSDPKHRVGAVILSDESHRPVAQGYNGRYPDAACEARISDQQGQSGYVHAEANALLFAQWETGAHTLYTTHEPCPECALLILARRKLIRRVFYRHPYACGPQRGSERLREGDIEVIEWPHPSEFYPYEKKTQTEALERIEALATGAEELDVDTSATRKMGAVAKEALARAEGVQ